MPRIGHMPVRAGSKKEGTGMIKAVFISKGGRREMLDFTNMDEYLAEAQKRHEELVFTSADTVRYTELRQGRTGK